MQLEPGGLLAWLVVGLVAGALAGMVMRGGGFGLIGDLVVAFLGAVLLIALLGGLTRRRTVVVVNE
jgi:uncharacterized membrane protein YeaQ/YmgE (transglycosylase-associated protein family)